MKPLHPLLVHFPIAFSALSLADKEPKPGSHEEFVEPVWKQGVGSTVHCVAGDATGIILAAVVTAPVGLPMWADLIVEYAAGFLFGLLIFQALFMRKDDGRQLRRERAPQLPARADFEDMHSRLLAAGALFGATAAALVPASEPADATVTASIEAYDLGPHPSRGVSAGGGRRHR